LIRAECARGELAAATDTLDRRSSLIMLAKSGPMQIARRIVELVPPTRARAQYFSGARDNVSVAGYRVLCSSRVGRPTRSISLGRFIHR